MGGALASGSKKTRRFGVRNHPKYSLKSPETFKNTQKHTGRNPKKVNEGYLYCQTVGVHHCRFGKIRDLMIVEKYGDVIGWR